MTDIASERAFWLAVYAAFMQIAKAIKRYKLGGEVVQEVTVTPSDNIAGIIETEKG